MGSIPSLPGSLLSRNRRFSSKPWAVVSQWSGSYGLGVHFEAVTFLQRFQLTDDFVGLINCFVVGHWFLLAGLLFWWFQGMWVWLNRKLRDLYSDLKGSLWYFVDVCGPDSWTPGEMNWEELAESIPQPCVEDSSSYTSLVMLCSRIITWYYMYF